MTVKKEKILGVTVCGATYDEFMTSILKDRQEHKKSLIVAINPEKIMKAQEDPSFLSLLNNAAYQIPDGIGVILASKLRGGNIKQRVTGIDMMMKLCETAAKENLNVFLYGAKPGVADTAKEKLASQFPTINIVGTCSGYEKDDQKIINLINQSKADILFVALGSPRQEEWAIKHMKELQPTIIQGVGGSYDVLSGNLKRAPRFFQNLGLEWLYRLIMEPWRWKRQLLLPKFLIKALQK
jgi:N-acetylglucosaminyldiphosphoundecaprenol N-acetyl-beta-D-mannosaminyltransferase